MKHIIFITFLVLAAFLFGCSEDNLLTNQSIDSTNSNELIFQLDSLSTSTSDSGWVYLMNTYTNIPIDYTGAMVVEFEGLTNLNDSAIKELYFSVKKFNSNYYSVPLQSTNEILGFNSYRFNVTKKSELNFIATIIYNNNSGYAFLKFNNIKVFKVN
jgi:hypothetical protein